MPSNTQKVQLVSKVGLLMLLVAGFVLVLAACDDGPKQTEKRKVASPQSASAASIDLVDPKDDVIADPKSSKSPKSVANSSGQSTAAADAASRKGRWSVILATFSDGDHAAKAAAFRSQLVAQYPELRDAAIRRVGKGSAIVVGRFESPEDAAAQAELKRVKAIERNKQRPFAGAMLLRTTSDDASGPPKAHDLRSLRAKFPNVRPLFTLQVGAWSTFGDKSLKYDDQRKAAERFCEELRKKGDEAWFLHDEDTETSIVTVGHFDRRAYDAKSTLFAPEVQDLMRQFPANLLNGEPVLIPLDPRNPKGKTRPQPCRLVEVPGV